MWGNTSEKPEISHCENRSVLKRLRLESSHCENTIHEEGRGGGGGGGGEGEELAVRKKNKNPTLRMWGIVKTQYEHISASLSKIYCNTSLGSQNV